MHTGCWKWLVDSPLCSPHISAGASQVKWNRKNQHLLASSHDGDVRIWDKRVCMCVCIRACASMCVCLAAAFNVTLFLPWWTETQHGRWVCGGSPVKDSRPGLASWLRVYLCHVQSRQLSEGEICVFGESSLVVLWVGHPSRLVVTNQGWVLVPFVTSQAAELLPCLCTCQHWFSLHSSLLVQYQLGSNVACVSVQFWDYRQPRKYLNILSCQVPVWKARYTVGLAPPALVSMQKHSSHLTTSAPWESSVCSDKRPAPPAGSPPPPKKIIFSTITSLTILTSQLLCVCSPFPAVWSPWWFLSSGGKIVCCCGARSTSTALSMPSSDTTTWCWNSSGGPRKRVSCHKETRKSRLRSEWFRWFYRFLRVRCASRSVFFWRC